MKGISAMRSSPHFKAILAFPAATPAPACEPLRATSEFPPTAVELQQVERDELRRLRTRLLKLIQDNEAERRGRRFKRAY
jgi:hypothetical protein